MLPSPATENWVNQLYYLLHCSSLENDAMFQSVQTFCEWHIHWMFPLSQITATETHETYITSWVYFMLNQNWFRRKEVLWTETVISVMQYLLLSVCVCMHVCMCVWDHCIMMYCMSTGGVCGISGRTEGTHWCWGHRSTQGKVSIYVLICCTCVSSVVELCSLDKKEEGKEREREKTKHALESA